MMRPKVFHGTNSITCANSVLPTFMRHPESFKPASIADEPSEIQIVDTHETLETRISISFAAHWHQMNRTLLKCMSQLVAITPILIRMVDNRFALP